MAFEIERKFLVGAEFKNMATAVEHIRQGYIYSKHGVTVRVRTCNEKGYLTIKGPSPDEPFERPPFLGREVTGDKRFYNAHMRKMPFKLWKHTLPEFREQN